MTVPSYLKSGSPARLFPVLATTSKEGRTTSIVLACMVLIKEFGSELLSSIDQKVGKRASLNAYTEVVFVDDPSNADRPDGLLILRRGASEWRALIETKIGNSSLSIEQIERYRGLAKTHGIDCVITISNQFASSPKLHPLSFDLNKRIKLPVFHWSWSFILTIVDLLFSNDAVEDDDQKLLLNELRRFLSHESAGVHGFSRMPPEWTELVKVASTGGKVVKTSKEVEKVVDAWHQESRDLSLILTRALDTMVREKLPKKLSADPVERRKQASNLLCDENSLKAVFEIPDAAAPLAVVANLATRSISVGMSLKAPDDRKSSKARLNWLLRQLKHDYSSEFIIRYNWPGRSESTQSTIADAKLDPSIIDKDRQHLQVSSFDILAVHKLSARFGQLSNFVSDLEDIVPTFYEVVGQNLTSWTKPAPKIKDDTILISEIAEEADTAAIGNL